MVGWPAAGMNPFGYLCQLCRGNELVGQLRVGNKWSVGFRVVA